MTIQTEGSKGDNFCVQCISYKQMHLQCMVKILFFRLNYGNSANHNIVDNKLDT